MPAPPPDSSAVTVHMTDPQCVHGPQSLLGAEDFAMSTDVEHQGDNEPTDDQLRSAEAMQIPARGYVTRKRPTPSW